LLHNRTYSTAMSALLSKRSRTDTDDLESLHRPVSPPPLRRKTTSASAITSASSSQQDVFEEELMRSENRRKLSRQAAIGENVLPSPFTLTRIEDLPESENVDTVGIKDILGDVMIREAWVFNFLVDLDWVM
jgi:tyrosyl-DNA phosphodiesterase 1